jgi:ERCC4-type nuclease
MEPVVLVIDARETKLIDELRKREAHFAIESLAVGDALFRRGAGTHLICERKTYADLAASIGDGRFREQRARLKEAGVPTIYLLEGPHRLRKEADAARVRGALENLAVVHGIHVLPTPSLAETAKSLLSLRAKLSEGYTAEPARIVKRKERIMENIFLHQLHCVPGVSLAIAARVVESYPSMRDLVLGYEACETPETLLADLRLSDGKRRIGPALSRKICTAIGASSGSRDSG